MVKTTIENSKYAASLLLIEGNYEYFKILDNNLADVMNKNITAEEAAKRIEVSWNKITDEIGRDASDPDLAQGRRERHLPRQVLSGRAGFPLPTLQWGERLVADGAATCSGVKSGARRPDPLPVKLRRRVEQAQAQIVG